MTPQTVRDIRHELGLTQDGLGRVLGVTGHAVRMWETGRRSISGPVSIALTCAQKHGIVEVCDGMRQLSEEAKTPA